MATRSEMAASGEADLSVGDAAANTSSPARGAEMRDFLQTRLLQRNRSPILVHSWEFWHDRQDRTVQDETKGETKGVATTRYEDRLVSLAAISDVKSFWNVFNNFDVSQLSLRDSVHLFHKGVKPIWEDPRNVLGGSWTFRVPKQSAPEFWKEVCMMAIGERLQDAVSSDRTTFRDDICGVSLSVRFNSYLVQVWNRDGKHEKGIQGIVNTVLTSLSTGLSPQNESSYYYKKHAEHAAFTGLDEIVNPSITSSELILPSEQRPGSTATDDQKDMTERERLSRAEATEAGNDIAYANAMMKLRMDEMAKERGH